jgi:hypothetical protein
MASFAKAVRADGRMRPACGPGDSLRNFALFSGVRGTYIGTMRTRDILVVVSVLGVAATLIAVIEGAWIYALAIYAMSVAGIAVLLGRAIRQHRARNDLQLRTAPD